MSENHIAREEFEVQNSNHTVVVAVLASDEDPERAIHRAEVEASRYRDVFSMNEKLDTGDSGDLEIPDPDIWTAKYDHEGETYTRDKDLMAHLQKLRDIEWEDVMMDVYEAPAVQQKIDRIVDDIESKLSDRARDTWDCDECGYGGGGLCAYCKSEAMKHG